MSRQNLQMTLLGGMVQISSHSRDYYRETWGFDPVRDWINHKDDTCAFEELFPLLSDPGLYNAYVKIGARVSFNKSLELSNNEIIFRCPVDSYKYPRFRESSVKCVHTVISAGSEDVCEACEDVTALHKIIRSQQRKSLRTGMTLPPWEHFVALKSFVSAIAEFGIANLLRDANDVEEKVGGSLPFGFNSRMQIQVIRAIIRVAPSAGSALLRDYLLELVEKAPRNWVESRLPYLSKSLHCDILMLEKIIKNV